MTVPGPQLWTAVERYVAAPIRTDAALDAAQRDSESAGLPPIQVTAGEGSLLQILARSLGATRVLEIGTLGGYSTIWLARALPPGGTVTTLELLESHARVARANLERAGVLDRVDVRVGAALETLPQLAAEGGRPFDFVFIDADKQNTVPYFDWALTLSRPGALIVVDNVVREGAVIDAHSTDESVQGIRRFHERLAHEPRVDVTVLQTVGSKGYDGMAIVRIRDDAPGGRAG